MLFSLEEMNITHCVVVVIAIVISYLVLRVLIRGYTTTHIMEGMENATGNSDGIAQNATDKTKMVIRMTEQLKDQLLMDKYSSDYEDTILALDDYLGARIVNDTLDMSFGKGSVPNMKQVRNLNDLVQAKKNLNDVLQSLDKLK